MILSGLLQKSLILSEFLRTPVEILPEFRANRFLWHAPKHNLSSSVFANEPSTSQLNYALLTSHVS